MGFLSLLGFMLKHLILTTILVLSIYALPPADVHATELDELINYLVLHRKADVQEGSSFVPERAAGIQTASISQGNQEMLLGAIQGWSIDNAHRAEEGGVVELSAVYYAKNKPLSFQVRMFFTAQGANLTKHNQLQVMKQLFDREVVKNQMLISGYPAALLEASDGNAFGFIVHLDNSIAVVRTPRATTQSMIKEFGENLLVAVGKS